jgi:hypothetical protein
MNMSVKSIGRSRVSVYVALAAFIVLVLPVGPVAQARAAAADDGSLSGFIYAKDKITPVAGAVVKIRNLSDQKELASPTTDANGMYTIAGIPEGRYLLGVTSADGNFDLNYTLYVKAGELGKLSLALAPGGGQEASEASAKKTGFFNSVAGRALIIAAIGVGLYFLIVPEPSPIR